MLASVTMMKMHADISRERMHSASSPHTAQCTGMYPTISAAKAPVEEADREKIHQ